jgi:transposase-like protein
MPEITNKIYPAHLDQQLQFLPDIKSQNKSQTHLQLQPEIPEKPKCPHCNTKGHVIRSGLRRNKRKINQRFQCKKCNRIFSNEPLANTSYSIPIILRAITYFNLGHTLQQTQKTMQRNYKTKIPISTLNTWLKRYCKEFSFIKLRRRFTLDPNTTIHSKKFHHQQVYEFKYHTLKTNIAGKTFPKLKSYISSIHKVPYFIPETVFQHGPRCSELRIDLKAEKTTKHNNAPMLAELAQTLATTNHDRHQQVEITFLINDTATIAIEVPVYIKPEEFTKQEQSTYGLNLKAPLSGHIDVLQVRFNKIHILDYKPNTLKNDKATIDQLFLYSLALSKRMKIPMNRIICAFFNDKDYFQFSI